mgnify:CR=1 FL=1
MYFWQDIKGQKGDDEADEETDGEVDTEDNEDAMDTHREIQKMSTAMCWMILCQFMMTYMPLTLCTRLESAKYKKKLT